MEPQSLDTLRLRLRPFTANDLEDYTRLIFADAEVIRYLPSRDLPPVERARRALTYFEDHWVQRNFGVWAVTDKVDGRLIGHCGLNHLEENGEVEVMYALAKADWGRGIATEAADASLRFGFEELKLETIIGLAMHANIASRRVLEHIGLTYEREVHYWGVDLMVYATTLEQFIRNRTATG